MSQASREALDRAAFDGVFRVPSWALSGSADAARQILTTVAAAIITVVGVVFSIVIVALTLTSTQFGPRMLRNFIRDPGTQITLGTCVGTFVYSVLALGSIGQESRGNFVPRRPGQGASNYHRTHLRAAGAAIVREGQAGGPVDEPADLADVRRAYRAVIESASPTRLLAP